ncbi:hypothetical protein F4818DRAFT_421675 [Hypoxylon cercidicola]|nr:hypothetical protein F4818DRAFT_421675 [Hypoxylon cercidicola]
MASITTRNGKRCTAVPKIANFQLSTSAATSTSSTSTSTSTSTSSSSSSTSTLTSTSTSSTSSSSSPSSSPSSTSSSTSTSTSTFTSTSTSSSSSSTSISATADQGGFPVANPAKSDPPAELSSSISTTSTSLPVTPPGTFLNVGTVISTSLTPTITDNASTSETSPVNSSPTESPNQSDNQVPSSDGGVDSISTTTASPVSPSVDSSSLTTPVGDTGLVPTGGSQSTSSPLESGMNGAGLSNSEAAVTGNFITTQQTIAISVGVVGGVVLISLIAFAFWLWRKRKMEERKTTLLTPLTPDATFRGDEKGPYLISRTSVGPTPFSEKLWAVAGTKYKRLRGRVNNIVARSSSPSPSVNLNRGPSQFGPSETMHSRNNSSIGAGTEEASTSKGRFVDWWGRLAEDANFNWRIRRESKVNPVANDSFAARRSTTEGNGPRVGSQPDFLTLLNMDDKQLERQAATRGRTSVSGNQRRSVSMGGEQHFLGGLGLDFDMADPFSDVNAISGNTARAKPLIVSAANNPFSDTNAIKAPPASAANGELTTYVQNIRRSRGRSMHGSISRQPSNAGTFYRESNVSVDTVGTRRTKFRSDPFDLDRPDFLQSANSSTDALAGGSSRASRGSRSVVGLPNTPRQAHIRTESFTSKYSSGVSGVTSMAQWSDPGPDVGPATRFTPSPDSGVGRRDSDTRRRSGSSQGSVGKAL